MHVHRGNRPSFRSSGRNNAADRLGAVLALLIRRRLDANHERRLAHEAATQLGQLIGRERT